MSKPKYQIGDRALVAGLAVEIIDIDYLKLACRFLYVVQFDNPLKLQTIVAETDIEPITT